LAESGPAKAGRAEAGVLEAGVLEAGVPEADGADGAAALEVFATPSLSVAAGRAVGERLAALPAQRRPTAAFCANDLLALGLLQGLTRCGLRVPQDIAIIGYDDIDFAAAAAVPLSSVRQPREQLGRTAAELLLEEVHDASSHEHRHVVFQPELVVRDSTVGRTATDLAGVPPGADRPTETRAADGRATRGRV
jgi:LacI family transcriptional regulator